MTWHVQCASQIFCMEWKVSHRYLKLLGLLLRWSIAAAALVLCITTACLLCIWWTTPSWIAVSAVLDISGIMPPACQFVSTLGEWLVLMLSRKSTAGALCKSRTYKSAGLKMFFPVKSYLCPNCQRSGAISRRRNMWVCAESEAVSEKSVSTVCIVLFIHLYPFQEHYLLCDETYVVLRMTYIWTNVMRGLPLRAVVHGLGGSKN